MRRFVVLAGCSLGLAACGASMSDIGGSGGHGGAAGSNDASVAGSGGTGGSSGTGGMTGSCAVPFVYAGHDAATVELRGDFRAGGWTSGVAMQQQGGQFTTSVSLTDGQIVQYKFLLDGSRWIADPANPNQAPDGLGGFNSVVTAHCSGGTGGTGGSGGSGDSIIVAAGDIAGDWPADSATDQLITSINPAAILGLGDMVYPDGSASQFAMYYEPSWGPLLSRTHPAPGNHDHDTADLAGYCSYFGAAGHCNGGFSYHSFDVGSWHIIALDSGCDSGCSDPMAAGSAMRTWLTADLASNTSRCTIAYWHHPRFSSGVHGNDTRSADVWNQLYGAGVDIILNGHDHNYERFAPQNPSGGADSTRGIVEFVVGTGGVGLRGLTSQQPNSLARDSSSHGVLKLTLHAQSYDYEFVPISGNSYTESGTGNCH